jgi:hypothetical protein
MTWKVAIFWAKILLLVQHKNYDKGYVRGKTESLGTAV